MTTKQVSSIVATLGAVVSGLDPSSLTGTEAARLVELFAEAERLSAAGRTLAAGRMRETFAWTGSGYRTAAEWMAHRTRSTMGDAITTLETAGLLSELPATRDAFAAGRLSEVQAAEIASAAFADPSAEASLLAVAEHETVKELKERCREVRAAAESDEDASERIRRSRYLRNWVQRDGAVRLDARLAPDDGAKLLAVVSASAARLQDEARRSGQRERAEAYAADALVGLATDGDRVHAVVHLEVDAAAFERGRVQRGETCRIPGVGPVGVAVARRLVTEGVLKLIERNGSDVTGVIHAGRTIPARVRSALEARDPTCVVPGCDVRTGLEIDHITPLAEGGPTSMDNLARLCRWHHAGKTHHGWRLEGKPRAWRWVRGRGRGAREGAGTNARRADLRDAPHRGAAAHQGRSPPARAP